MSQSLSCERCGTRLFAWHIWPTKGSRHEGGAAHLTCVECGWGYMPTTIATIICEVAAMASLLGVTGASVSALLWAGKLWGGPALQHVFLGRHADAVLPALAFFAFAGGVFALAVVAFTMVGQVVTAAAWRSGGYRPESGIGSTVLRVRVEQRGEPSLGGYRDEQLLVDGEVVGPSIGTGQMGFRGCHSWYRLREGAEDVTYYLRSWGTGRDVPHVLFREDQLWSEKRSGGLTGPLIGALVGGVLGEGIGAFSSSGQTPVWLLGTMMVLGILGGVAIGPLQWQLRRTVLPPPEGVWLQVEDSPNRQILKTEKVLGRQKASQRHSPWRKMS